jgi:hypothetical protein
LGSEEESRVGRRVGKVSDALVSMFGYPRGGFEKEGLFCGHVVEKTLLDGGLTTPGGWDVKIRKRSRSETDPC